jgi:CheY-like chemotaxis protein
MIKKLDCILLIDDNDADNEFHQIIINRMGITDNIQVAEDGVEAITYLTSENNVMPELIFLDINMPRMNGWEFLEEYKKLGLKKKQIIILMLTTSVNPEDRERAQRIEEVTGFRVKPLTQAMFKEILESYF